eukprot:jgi/Mesen1/10906/ME000095S10244
MAVACNALTSCATSALASNLSSLSGTPLTTNRLTVSGNTVATRRRHQLKIEAKTEKEEPKESLFTSITNALDFTAVRSEKDAELLSNARDTIANEKRMSAEQYAALRRKVGGTAKSYFKEFIEVDGKYTDEGWVDKKCKYCGKDTSRDPRQKDASGRYAHVECATNAKAKGNFFTNLFNR